MIGKIYGSLRHIEKYAVDWLKEVVVSDFDFKEAKGIFTASRSSRLSMTLANLAVFNYIFLISNLNNPNVFKLNGKSCNRPC